MTLNGKSIASDPNKRKQPSEHERYAPCITQARNLPFLPAFHHAGPMGGSHSVWCVFRILTSSAVSHADQFLGLVTVMFAGTGTLLNTSKRLQNQGKVCILPLFNLRLV